MVYLSDIQFAVWPLHLQRSIEIYQLVDKAFTGLLGNVDGVTKSDIAMEEPKLFQLIDGFNNAKNPGLHFVFAFVPY